MIEKPKKKFEKQTNKRGQYNARDDNDDGMYYTLKDIELTT